MSPKNIVCFSILMLLMGSSCTSTRYLTDETSIKRQREMRSSRAGGNVGDVFINFASLFLSATLNTGYEIYSRDRAFKRITIANESNDSLFVSMVTDIVWKESGYCDIMGIALPAGARQTLLAPYPAAYNVYFRKPGADEEKLEIRTDGRFHVIRLKPGMTLEPEQKKSENQ